jgi:hypothetical protein
MYTNGETLTQRDNERLDASDDSFPRFSVTEFNQS